MLVFIKILFITISLAACKPASEVKVSQNRDALRSTVNKLFSKLIGRAPAAEELASYRGKNYPEILSTLLASEAYQHEGFYHLHRNRLFIDDSSESFKAKSADDLHALKLELSEVAKSDNYWDILTYRERWIGYRYPDLPRFCLEILEAEVDNEAKIECTKFMQAALSPSFEGKTYDSYTYASYHKPCCLDVLKPSYCPEIKSQYQDLFSKDFCQIKDGKEIVLTEEQLIPSIFFLISMRLYDPNNTNDNNRFLKLAVPASPVTQGKYLLNNVEITTDGTTNTFLKILVPEDLQGIHANPYWLSRHRTTAKNKHLHRARVVLLSWLCEDISPDAATVSGKKVESKQMLKFKNYFATDDPIATGDQVCFNCHKKIQPIANYFGKLHMGTNYSEDYPPSYFGNRFFNNDSAFVRPGVFYDPQQGSFYDHYNNRFDSFQSRYEHLLYYPDKNQCYDVRKQKYLTPEEANVGHAIESYGMTGLAATLSSLPAVKKCVVESTWNAIFGSKWGLSSDEVDAAISSFENSGHNYRTLLQHLLTKEKAKVFFSSAAGEKKFEEMVSKERLTCDAVQKLHKGELSVAAPKVFQANCVKCHNEEGDEFMGTHLVEEDGALVADYDMNIVLERVISLTDPMPPYDYADDAKLNADQQQKTMECFLEKELGIDITPAKEQEEDLSKIHQLEN